MAILTLKHCLFCYKENGAVGSSTQNIKTETENDSDENSAKKTVNCNPLDARMTFASNLKALNRNKNSEICRRFCTLASRHFNLNPEYFKPGRTLNSKWQVNFDQACDSCAEMLSSFCDIYLNWQYLAIQLNYRACEIVEVMKEADDPSSEEHAKDRESLTKKMKENDLTMEDIDDFRKGLKDKVEREKNTTLYPVLALERESEDLFERVPSKKKSSSGPAVNQKNEELQTQPKREASKSSLTKKRSRKAFSGSGRPDSACSVSSDDFSIVNSEDLFRPITVPVKKKSKKSTTKKTLTESAKPTDDVEISILSELPRAFPDPESSKSKDVVQQVSKDGGSRSVANSSDHGISSMCGDHIYIDLEEEGD